MLKVRMYRHAYGARDPAQALLQQPHSKVLPVNFDLGDERACKRHAMATGTTKHLKPDYMYSAMHDAAK